MADPATRATVTAAPTFKAGDPVSVVGRVLRTTEGDLPEVRPGVTIRFESTIPHGATVVTLPRHIASPVAKSGSQA